MIKLLLREIADQYVRRNFELLQSYFDKNRQLEDFQHVELTFTGAAVNYKYPHGFSFTPADIVQTSLKGPGTVTWNYALFDGTNLDLTIAGTPTVANPIIVRAFIGRFTEGG